MTNQLIDVPRDNLFRGLTDTPIELRDGEASDGTTMFGHFTKFDTWTEIDSWYEGRFLERFVPGSFRKTINESRDRVRVQYDHGYDVYVGSAILGPIDVLRDEDDGVYYEVPLLDTDYNRDRILPMLRGQLMTGDKAGSVLGASHRFRVVKEEWVEPSKATDSNPDKLPERTIREASLYEFGPVAFPAQRAATSGVRSISLTDHFNELALVRSGRAQRAVERLSSLIVPAASSTGSEQQAEPIADHSPRQTSVAFARAQLEILKTRKVTL
jgi:HK97 family phage prohead protease